MGETLPMHGLCDVNSSSSWHMVIQNTSSSPNIFPEWQRKDRHWKIFRMAWLASRRKEKNTGSIQSGPVIPVETVAEMEIAGDV